MDIGIILKVFYHLFIRLPYITAFVFFIASIYHFKNGDDCKFFDSLYSLGFSLVAILSYIISFDILLPKLFEYNSQGEFIQLLKGFIEYIIQPMIILILSIGITDNDKLISERFKIICFPPIFLFLLAITGILV